VAEILLRAGANVCAVDKRQRTPLHYAVDRNGGDANSSTAMEQLLLDNGANPMAEDCRKRLPLHYVFVKIGR
jgi:ankyrin repeat protein